MQPDTSAVRAKLADLSEIGGQTKAVEKRIHEEAAKRHDWINQQLNGDISEAERTRLLEERARLMQVMTRGG